MAKNEWLTERIAGWVCTWGEYLLDRDEAELTMRMRRRENTGRPLGDESFVAKLSVQLGRDLRPKKPGRKPKTTK